MVFIKEIDVALEHQKLLIDFLKTYIPNTTAWAYGSRVDGTSQPNSDLDIVVLASKEQKLEVSLLKEALEESNLPFRVDLFTWDEIPESFQQNILKKHIILTEKS